MRSERVKVFGIGLNKTATRSVAAACRIVGLRTLHKGDDATSRLVDESAEFGEPLLSRIGDKWDAYFDVDAIVKRFRELDESYPGSKFILTTRPEDEWLASRRKHVEANQKRPSYAGSFVVVDEEGWRRERALHHAAVEQHFQGRDDLLIYDARDGWPPLASFLGRSLPDVPFPWENRDGRGTYMAGAGALRQIPRRVVNLGRRFRL